MAAEHERKMLARTEANLAGRTQVENTGALKLVSCTPQVLAKAKDAIGGRNTMKGRKKVSVEEEQKALKAKGAYYAEGEGPPLEELEDAWVGYHLWAETTNGHEIKCSMIGRDGYMETARVAIETAMCLLFDKLPFKGGVLTPTVACGENLLKRMVAGNLKFRMGEWVPIEERCPPPWPQ